MIIGYAGDFSVLPGSSIDLHFSADVDGTQARVHFFRFGLKNGGAAGWVHVGSSNVAVFDHFPRGSHDQAWGWPTFS